MTREECINILQQLNIQLGRRPTFVEARKAGLYHFHIKKYFDGSFNAAIQAAGLIPFERSIPTLETRTCKNPSCSQEFTVNSYEKKRFCSISCSNSVLKVKHGQFTKSKQCPHCGVYHTRALSRHCSQLCYLLHSAKQVTKESAMVRVGGANAYDLIRSRAKYIAKLTLTKTCHNCGYDKHVELAHKQPISGFDLNATLDVINHPTNLVYLCPNCHWEYDNGLLKLE